MDNVGDVTVPERMKLTFDHLEDDKLIMYHRFARQSVNLLMEYPKAKMVMPYAGAPVIDIKEPETVDIDALYPDAIEVTATIDEWASFEAQFAAELTRRGYEMRNTVFA